MTATTCRDTCPVCVSEVRGEPTCARCGWVLTAGPWLGMATAQDRQGFEEKLVAARRQFDLKAAVRAAGSDADDAVVLRLARLARGGSPTAAELADARDNAPGLTGISMAEAVRPALARLVEDPDGGGPRALTLAEVRTEGVAWTRLRADELGVPAVTGSTEVMTWQDLFASLPRPADECLLTLAGGVGAHGPVNIRADEIAAARRVLQRRTDENPDELLLLHRLAGWPIPDRLVAGLEVRRIRPDEPELDADRVAGLIPLAPLRHDYRLVLIELDEQHRTRPVARTLFPAGTTAASSSEETVPVVAPMSDGQPVVLAVISGPGGTPPRLCRPVTVTRCALTPGSVQDLRFRLEGPGQVRLVEPVGSRPDQETAWPDRLGGVPEVYRQAEEMDVVFAIELGGSASEVSRRRELVVEMIRLIEKRNPDGVRVAAVGYHDHAVRRPAVLDRSGFLTPAAGREYVTGLPSSPMIEPLAAPVEDALYAARGWRPAPVARRLVLVGGRPPFPTKDSAVARCPNGVDWRGQLARLERDDVQYVAVWDKPAWFDRGTRESQRVEGEWRKLSRRPRQTMLLNRIDPNRAADHADLLGATERPAPLLFPLAVGDIPQEDRQ